MTPTNFERAFEVRPDAYAGWVALNTAIKSSMDLRRYELATLAAAQWLRSTYCSLAHGAIVLDGSASPCVTSSSSAAPPRTRAMP